MHFAFIPVVQDKKRDRLKVCANECVTRLDLQKFHSELQEHLERRLGCQVDILNEATREGNKSIAELKRESATQRLEKAKEKATKIVSTAKYEARVREDMARPIEADYKAKEAILKALETEPSMRGIKFEKPIMGKNYYKVEPERMDELLEKEKLYPAIKEANKELTKELDKIKETLTIREYSEAIRRHRLMKEALAVEQQKTQQLQQQLNKYKSRYGELEEPQQEKSKKIIYKSKSKSQGYDITD